MSKIIRREFLTAAAASVVANCLPGDEAPKKTTENIVDTHTHFYDPTRPQGIPWPAKTDKLLYRRVLPDEFARLTKPFGVTGTIVVEASPWLEDNQWLLNLAKEHPSLLGIVGNLKPGEAEFSKHLDRFARNELFRGIRINQAALANGLDRQAFIDDLRKLADVDRQLDVNGGPGTPAFVAKLARAIPALRIVINHAANVRIDGKTPPDDWLRAMADAARNKNVWCKVSALVEGTGRKDASAPKEVEFYKPVLDALWERFGEDRLMYGSNWPVSARFASYETVFKLADAYVSSKGKQARRKFFEKNALAAYRWPAKGG